MLLFVTVVLALILIMVLIMNVVFAIIVRSILGGARVQHSTDPKALYGTFHERATAQHRSKAQHSTAQVGMYACMHACMHARMHACHVV